MKVIKKILSIFLRIGISIILLVFLFKQVDRRSLAEAIGNSNKYLLAAAFFITAFGYILCLFRWKMLLKAAKIHLSLKRVIMSFSGGLFFSLFLPSTIGGDVMRSIDLAAHTKRPREVVATVLLDRLSGYIGLVTLALLAILLGRGIICDGSVFIAVGVITAILIGVLLVLFSKFFYSKVNKLLHSPPVLLVPWTLQRKRTKVTALREKIRSALRSLHQEIHIFRHHKGVMFGNVVVSLFIQASSPIAFYITALSLGIKVNIVYFFIFLPIIGAITLLPISIGGLGLRDATTIFFFAKVGITKDLAFAMSLLNFFFIVICSGIGGLIYVLTIHHRRIQHHQSPAVHTPHQP